VDPDLERETANRCDHRLGAGRGQSGGFLWALFSQGPTVEIDSGVVPDLLPPGVVGLVIGTLGWLSALIALLVIAKVPPGSDAALRDSAPTVDSMS
jgi:hypothetical protein